jgi:ZPR1 zinc finger protein
MSDRGAERDSSSSSEKVSVYAESSGEFRVKCPVCGSEAIVRESLYELPRVGKAFLVSVVCKVCGYKRSDVVPCKVKKRVRIYYAVDSLEDLDARVVRSAAATVEIPELGVYATPGAAASTVITNVEGILRMIQDAALSIEVLEGGAKGFAERLEEIIGKGGRFTLIIDDPWGLSSIEPPKNSANLMVEEVEGPLNEGK